MSATLRNEEQPVRIDRRPAQPGDYAFLRALHHATMRAYVEPIWGWDEVEQKRLFDLHFNSTTAEIISMEGQDVGAVTIERQEESVFLSNIQILPEFQGHGVGTAIIKEMLATAHAHRLPATLRVLKNNPAKRLYERLGFHVTGETETHYVMCSGPL
jgi:ribosomal protein S18 acetylase RimI-like enzyme